MDCPRCNVPLEIQDEHDDLLISGDCYECDTWFSSSDLEALADQDGRKQVTVTMTVVEWRQLWLACSCCAPSSTLHSVARSKVFEALVNAGAIRN